MEPNKETCKGLKTYRGICMEQTDTKPHKSHAHILKYMHLLQNSFLKYKKRRKVGADTSSWMIQ